MRRRRNWTRGTGWCGWRWPGLICEAGRRTLAQQAAKRAEQFGGDLPPVQHALALFYAGAGDSPRAADWERRYAGAPGTGAEAAASAAALSSERRSAAGGCEVGADRLGTARHSRDAPPARHSAPRAGQLDAALPELRAAAKAAPAEELFVSDYAQALLERLDFAEAVAVLDAARRLFPKSPQVLLSFGVACYGERRFADSVGAFLQVIRLDGSIEQPYLFLGRLLEHAGDRLPEVIAAYAAWERKAPDNYLPVFLYAKALAAASAPDEAAVENEVAPVDSAERLLLGVAPGTGRPLLRQGKWQESAQELSRSIGLNPRNASAHYHLARAYQRLGKPELAQAERAEYQRLKDAEGAAGLP